MAKGAHWHIDWIEPLSTVVVQFSCLRDRSRSEEKVLVICKLDLIFVTLSNDIAHIFSMMFIHGDDSTEILYYLIVHLGRRFFRCDAAHRNDPRANVFMLLLLLLLPPTGQIETTLPLVFQGCYVVARTRMLLLATIHHGCSITNYFYLRWDILASKGEFGRLHYLIIAFHAKLSRFKLLQYFIINSIS